MTDSPDPDFYVIEEIPDDKASLGTDPSEKHFAKAAHTVVFESEVDYDVQIALSKGLKPDKKVLTVPANGQAQVNINPRRKGRFLSKSQRKHSQCPTCQTTLNPSKVLPDFCEVDEGTAYARRAEGEPIIIID